MIFINEKIDSLTNIKDKGPFEYKSTKSGQKLVLSIDKKTFREKGYTDNVYVNFVRLFVEGSGQFVVNGVNVYKYGKKFAKLNTLENFKPTFPITVTINGGGFVDVPVEVMDEKFEIETTPAAGMKIYACIDGLMDNIEQKTLEEYNKLNP